MTGSPQGGNRPVRGGGSRGAHTEDCEPPGGESFTGVVLAGGASTRMGRDKSLIEVGGVPMVQRVARTMSDAGASGILVAGGDVPRLSRLGLSVVPDRERGLGPLSGLAAAMAVIERGYPPERGEGPLMVSAPCDTPLLSSELIVTLVGALRADANSAIVVTEGPRGLEPLLAAWRVNRCREAVSQRLASGRRSVRGLFDILSTGTVRWDDRVELTNVNTPEDLRSLPSGKPPNGPEMTR